MKLDFKEFYKILTNYILLNFLVLGVSIFGITFGAALTASYNVSFKLLDTKRATYVVKDFFISFKKNFIKATIYYLLLIVIMVLLFFIHNYAINSNIEILRLAVYITLLEVIIVSNYFFPVLSMFEGPFVLIFKNSVLLAHSNLFQTLKILGTNALMLLLFFKVHSMTILVMIGLFVFLNAFHLNKTFSYLIKKTIGE